MDNAATNPVLQSFKDGLPKLANLSEKQCYYGLGKALLEFESRIGEIESKIEGCHPVEMVDQVKNVFLLSPFRGTSRV